MTKDEVLISKCLRDIELQLDWIESNNWQQNHFESLSELIYEKTKVKLSPLTLKRLWGKIRYDSKPSTVTLDTLAQFLGYNNWIDYQCINKRIQIKSKPNVLNGKKILIAASLLLGSVIILIVSLTMRSPQPKANYSGIDFSVKKLSSDLPNTVYFKYNVKNTDADSVMIQQSWDSRLSHNVDKNKTNFSCIYYYPGYYKAKLLLDHRIVSEKELHIKTNGWLGIVHKDPVPYYLPANKVIDGNKLNITKQNLINAGFDLRNKVPFTTLNLVEDFDNIDAEHFNLQASFKQTLPEGEAICEKSALIILCSNGYFYIPFSIKGCVNELQLYIPNKAINATDVDLSSLGIESNSPVNVSLKVNESVFDLTVNNNTVLNDTLSENPGKIVGIKFGFHGSGEVYSFQINSKNTTYKMTDFWLE